jgi:hypothetical protein
MQRQSKIWLFRADCHSHLEKQWQLLSPAQRRWRVLPRPGRPQSSPRAASCTGETTPPNWPSPPSQASPRPMGSKTLASEIRTFHAQSLRVSCSRHACTGLVCRQIMLMTLVPWPRRCSPCTPALFTKHCIDQGSVSSGAGNGANGLRECLSQKVAFEALSNDIAVQRGRAQQKVHHRSIHDFLLLAWQRQAHPASSACQLQTYDIKPDQAPRMAAQAKASFRFQVLQSICFPFRLYCSMRRELGMPQLHSPALKRQLRQPALVCCEC